MGIEKVEDIDINVPPPLVMPDHTTKVATTLSEFQNMILAARVMKPSDGTLVWIQATEQIARYFLKEKYDPSIGYFIYSDVFVFEDGRKDDVLKKMNLKMDQILFGHSTVKEAALPGDVDRDPRGARD